MYGAANAPVINFPPAAAVPALQLNSADYFPVLWVIDGDTIDVATKSCKLRIRLLGINAPELKTADQAAECYGDQAKAALSQKLSGAKVYLEPDPSQGSLDKYGRTLAYVWLGSGASAEDVDLWLIEQGLAREYTYDQPYKYQTIFREAEKKAQAAETGLWGICE